MTKVLEPGTETTLAVPFSPTTPTDAPGALGFPPHGRGRDIRRTSVRAGIILATGLVLLGLWALLARAAGPTVVPGPDAVWASFRDLLANGTYLPALATTAQEAGLGWAVAVLVAFPLGYLIGRFPLIEDALAPYLAGSQAMPVVAIAPLLVLWVGLGSAPKIIVCALIAFFPILATTASGIRGIPRDLRDAALVFGASRLSTAIHVYIPLALRQIFAGLKVGAALAVTGAVVGEFVNCDQGLGCLVISGRESYDTALEFVALLSLIALGAAAYTVVTLVERLSLRWEE